MASDKITRKILQDAETEARAILDKANAEAETETRRITEETEMRLQDLEEDLFDSQKKELQRAQLNAGLEERKASLKIRRDLMEKAFRRAEEKLYSLPRKKWEELVTRIVLAGTSTDTRYIRVPEADFKRYVEPQNGQDPFLLRLNEALRKQGHTQKLRLDKNPAHFRGGLMLIGEYSDVNASFDVLLENQKELIEGKVVEILFGESDE